MKKQIMTAQINSLGTLSRQGELKSLPVPELEDTMAKWLLTTKPHLSKSEFDKTKGNLKIRYLNGYLLDIPISKCMIFVFF